MFQRISNGWRLTKASFKVLSLDKEILALPIMSAVLLTITVLGLGFGLLPVLVGGDIISLAALFIIYVAVYFVVIFFNAAVIEMAAIRFAGGDPTLKDGLGRAWSKAGRIFQWAIVAATLGLIFRALRNQSRNNFLARLMVGLLEGAWNLVTYFAVPVAIFEDVGPIEAIKRSTRLVKGTWGETITGMFTTGIVFFVLGLAGLVPLFLGVFSGTVAGLVFGLTVAVLWWVLLAAANSAVDGILTAALYVYAKDGQMPEAYQQQGFTGTELSY